MEIIVLGLVFFLIAGVLHFVSKFRHYAHISTLNRNRLVAPAEPRTGDILNLQRALSVEGQVTVPAQEAAESTPPGLVKVSSASDR